MNEKQTAIIQALACIPKGCVCSYGDLAKRAGYPGYARYVGYILKNLPQDSHLPWHRVINGQGKIAFPEHSSKYQQQKQKLEQEGIIFGRHSLLKRYSIDNFVNKV